MSWYSIVRRGGTASSPWDPSLFPSGDLRLWLRADEPTLYDATSGGSLVTTDGATVRRWEDDAGIHTGASALACSNATAPELKTNILNGKPVVRITDDTAGFIRINPPIYSNSPSSIGIVMLANPVAGAGAWISVGGFKPWIMREGSRMSLRSSSWLATVNTTRYDSAADVPDNVWLMASGVMDFANSAVTWDLDGGVLTRSYTVTFSPTTASNVDRINLGCRYAETTDVPGLDVAEVVFYTNDGTAATRQKVEGYLAHKWGVTGNLPAAHPYKNLAPTA